MKDYLDFEYILKAKIARYAIKQDLVHRKLTAYNWLLTHNVTKLTAFRVVNKDVIDELQIELPDMVWTLSEQTEWEDIFYH